MHINAFEDLERVYAHAVGHKLLTVLTIDVPRSLNRRVHSSNPVAYPRGGTKPLRTDSEFYRTIVVGGTPRLCATPQACRDAFPDYPIFEALGCGSAVNIPVIAGGITIGSINVLHEAGWYHQDMFPLLLELAALAVPLLKQPSEFEE